MCLQHRVVMWKISVLINRKICTATVPICRIPPNHSLASNTHSHQLMIANLLKLQRELPARSTATLSFSLKSHLPSYLSDLIVHLCYITSDLFFAFAYICFTLASIYLVKLVNLSIESNVFKVINLCICLLQNVAYLLVAFSNPGVKLA